MKTTQRMFFHLRCLLALVLGVCLQASVHAQEVLEIPIINSGATAFGEPRTVQVGQQVRWVNRSGAVHSVTRDVTPRVDLIPVIDDGEATTVTITAEMFDANGRMPYFCKFHPIMRSELRRAGSEPIPVPTPDPGSNVTINVTGSGGSAQIIQDGATTQAPVNVTVGQRVRWVNQTPQQHVFDHQPTEGQAAVLHLVVPANGFAEKLFTSEDFQRAGGQGTGNVTIRYVSQVFDSVGSSIVLTGAAPSPPEPVPAPAPPANANIPAAIGAPLASIAVFEDVIVDNTIKNSYYILAADLNNDGKKDLVTSGLGAPEQLARPNLTEKEKDQYRGTIAWYENPGRVGSTWQRREVIKLDVPVPIDAADIDGDGLVDIATSWNYGLCIFHCNPDNGITSWLKNPGVRANEPWKRFPVGNLMANHRLFFGHYTQSEKLELLALPVVGGADGQIHQPLKSTVYVQPDDPVNAENWQAIVANDKYTLVHDASIHKFRARDGSFLDSAIIAGGEGVSWLYFDGDKKWKSIHLGTGEQEQPNPNGFRGSGGVAACRFGTDPFSYIASQEPLHGNILAIYSKDSDGSLNTLKWKRHIVDTFGPVNASGEGPMHQVIAADFDGDGNDEFLVALRGPLPYQGVYLYKAVDPTKGKFVRQRISFISTARIAVADFDSDGRLDFATAPYDVSTYYDAREPHILMFYNRTPQKGNTTTGVCATCTGTNE